MPSLETNGKILKDYNRGYQDALNLLYADIPEADLENDWYMMGYWDARNDLFEL